ncbi:MAG TPA: serine hydrolase [Blastocatellia bacterium]|nr:serine hydrolase [Blastocatellia bacterium]
MRRILITAVIAVALLTSGLTAVVGQAPTRRSAVYYPAAGDKWQRKAPAEAGFDTGLLEEAVAFAKTQETKVPRDFSTQIQTFGALLGPMPRERGETNGMIIRHGYIVAEWGDTNRIDPTYSVAKSFLSTVLGLTIDRGMIKSIDDPVRVYIKDGGYDSPHNSKITWRYHANQTSEWEGVMFSKSHDFIGVEQFGAGARQPRELREPGQFYEYNDVRINRFSLSLLELWKQPLPAVIKQYVMDPIGASNTWQYHGYNNSEVTIDGKKLISVSGGTRWGGGLWINTRDEARFGLLFLRRGKWGEKQIIPEKWVEMATTPGPLGPDYGFLWWLNTQKKQWPSAPASSFAAIGYGSNTIWVDPEHDLVVVWRWHQGNGDELFKRILAAIKRDQS